MAYQALYRKYRPKNFDDVVGQQAIIQTLKNAKAKDRIAHAYLFCGPRGTGKTSIAKIFARMLNCTSTDETQPCGHCENCKIALEGSHPDIIEIDAASNNGVDEVRNLIDRVKYAPMQGQYKIYIIDEAHMMTKGAFNALLKTIEEPPKHIIFIFATTEPNALLPTIISRCQRFDFAKVSMADIQKRLTVVCQTEKIQIDKAAIELIASLSEGGMRDALSILDQCVAYCSDSIHIDDVRTIYGVTTLKDIGRLFQHLYKKEIEELISELQSISDQGMDLIRFTSDFISLLKNSVIYDYAPDTTLIDSNVKEVLKEYFMFAPNPFRMQVLDSLMDTYNKFRYASNVLDYLETGLLKTISHSHEQSYDKSSNISEMKKNENQISKYDLSSEKSDNSISIHREEPKIKENKLSESKNVSRETLKKSDNTNRKIIYEDEYILRLLVSANKEERAKDSQKYEKINDFISDLNYMRPANLLKKTKILASGLNYILINVGSELESKEINEYENDNSFDGFIEEILGSRKKVFCIDQVQAKRVINQFKERMQAGNLPDKIEIELEAKKCNSDELDKKSPIEKIFKNIEIRED